MKICVNLQNLWKIVTTAEKSNYLSPKIEPKSILLFFASHNALVSQCDERSTSSLWCPQRTGSSVLPELILRQTRALERICWWRSRCLVALPTFFTALIWVSVVKNTEFWTPWMEDAIPLQSIIQFLAVKYQVFCLLMFAYLELCNASV